MTARHGEIVLPPFQFSAAIADDGMVYIACNTETGPTWGRGVGAVYAIDPASPHNVTVPVPERKVAVAT